MDNASLIKYANGRFKVYTYHKLNLKVDMSKEEFDDCVNELFDDIEKDTHQDKPDPLLNDSISCQRKTGHIKSEVNLVSLFRQDECLCKICG